jgi:hypothetical protein
MFSGNHLPKSGAKPLSHLEPALRIPLLFFIRATSMTRVASTTSLMAPTTTPNTLFSHRLPPIFTNVTLINNAPRSTSMSIDNLFLSPTRISCLPQSPSPITADPRSNCRIGRSSPFSVEPEVEELPHLSLYAAPRKEQSLVP